MSLSHQEKRTPEKGREKLPSWIREAGSMHGLAEAMKNPEVQAAYYPAPPHPEIRNVKSALKNKLLKNIHLEWTEGEDGYSEDLPELFKGKQEKILKEFPELGSAGVATLKAILEDLEALQKAFPDYSLAYFDIRTCYKAAPALLWHQDREVMPDQEILFAVRTYCGPSTEYAEKQDGSNPLERLPDGSIVIHRGRKPRVSYDPNLPMHRIPEIPPEGRLSLMIFLLKERR